MHGKWKQRVFYYTQPLHPCRRGRIEWVLQGNIAYCALRPPYLWIRGCDMIGITTGSIARELAVHSRSCTRRQRSYVNRDVEGASNLSWRRVRVFPARALQRPRSWRILRGSGRRAATPEWGGRWRPCSSPSSYRSRRNSAASVGPLCRLRNTNTKINICLYIHAYMHKKEVALTCDDHVCISVADESQRFPEGVGRGGTGRLCAHVRPLGPSLHGHHAGCRIPWDERRWIDGVISQVQHVYVCAKHTVNNVSGRRNY